MQERKEDKCKRERRINATEKEGYMQERKEDKCKRERRINARENEG